MFLLIVTAFPTLVLAYLAWRASSVPFLARRVPRRTLWLGAAVLWVLLLGGPTAGRTASFPGAGLLEAAGMVVLGSLFLCFLAMLLAELITGCGLWLRGTAPRIRGLALGAGLGLSLLALVQGLRPPQVVDYHVTLPGLPAEREGLVLVALSDLHLGNILGPRWMAARLEQVRALRPDLVVLLGDTFEMHQRLPESMAAPLRGLEAPLGLWAVEGNHDRDQVPGGARLLRDGLASPCPGLLLAGRRDPGYHPRPAERPWNPPAERPQGALILLSHVPRDPEGAAAAGTALMLSGHTHAGQIWPFGHLVALVHRRTEGLHRIGDMSLIVNRGTGSWGPPMRLWRRGEISRIVLHSGAARP